MRPSSDRRSTADGAPLRARPGRRPTIGRARYAPGRGVSRMQAGGRFAPVGAAFRGYLRGQSLCGLWNDPVCLTVFFRREPLRRLPRPPAAVLPPDGHLRPGAEKYGSDFAQRPCGGAERRERAAGGGDARFSADASISSPGLRPGNARPRAAAGKKARSGPLIRVSLTVGRAASRVGPPTLERRFTGSAGLRASRAGGEPARDPEGRAGGPSEPPDRAGAFLCSKERTGYPAPHTHPCRARPAARPPCPRAGTKEPDPAAEGLETGLALRAAARHLTAARNGGCVLLRCPRR